VRKAFIGPLAPRRPCRQVVPYYSRHQDVLQVKKVASNCPASSWSHQDVTYSTISIESCPRLIGYMHKGRRLILELEVWKSYPVFHTLPATRHRCKHEVWTLAQVGATYS